MKNPNPSWTLGPHGGLKSYIGKKYDALGIHFFGMGGFVLPPLDQRLGGGGLESWETLDQKITVNKKCYNLILEKVDFKPKF